MEILLVCFFTGLPSPWKGQLVWVKCHDCTCFTAILIHVCVIINIVDFEIIINPENTDKTKSGKVARLPNTIDYCEFHDEPHFRQ